MPALIRGRDIHKRYVPGRENFVDALQGASLDIEEGEMAAIMGPSGSGKSTLLHILGCLDSLNAGEVWLAGRRVDDLGGRDLTQLRRKEVGFIFQTFNLVPSLTAIENVALAAQYAGKGSRDAREAARQVLSEVELSDRENHRPPELSGGQQQRVAIARALVNNAPVILADEPTGNLDTKTSMEIMELVVQLNQDSKTTVIVVTHEQDIARFSKRIIRFLDGHILSDQLVVKND